MVTWPHIVHTPHFDKIRQNQRTKLLKARRKLKNKIKSEYCEGIIIIISKKIKMSVTSSFPCIKIPTCSSSPSSCASSSSSTSSSHHSLRFSSSKAHYYHHAAVTTIRNSQTEGPLRRPAAPSVREPSGSIIKPTPPSSQPKVEPPPPPPPPLKGVSVVVGDDKSVVTLEFQRQKAKELQEYFKQKKLEEADQGPLFGFIGKNEINNGRWAMFGFAVGMLTEYATGSDFVDQVKILLSNFGIIDLE